MPASLITGGIFLKSRQKNKKYKEKRNKQANNRVFSLKMHFLGKISSLARKICEIFSIFGIFLLTSS
jgi:hypothetical protein